MSMRFVSPAIAAGLACLLLSGGAAMAACKSSPDSLFVDRFEQLDDTWGTYENYDVEDGKLVIKPPAGYNTTAINNTSLYDDVDICVDMSAEAPVQEGSCGSIVFWAIDYDNYYSFQVNTEGEASFWRRQRDKWLNQVGWQDAPGVAKGATVINELRVITSGRTAKLYINGQFFKQVKGQPPKDGSLVGLMACAPNDATAHIAFTNLVVNTPKPETTPAADKAGGEAAGGGATMDSGAGAKPSDSGAASGGAGDNGGKGAAAPASGNDGASGAAGGGNGSGASGGAAPSGSNDNNTGGSGASSGNGGANDNSGGASGGSGGSSGGGSGSSGGSTGK
jgi:hypothetical protein